MNMTAQTLLGRRVRISRVRDARYYPGDQRYFGMEGEIVAVYRSGDYGIGVSLLLDNGWFYCGVLENLISVSIPVSPFVPLSVPAPSEAIQKEAKR